MAADEEAKARAQLAEMQMRISEGPASALGVYDSASEQEIRAAFLALTKQYHPARFGRLAPDLQRFATEVYLGIKDAHERMLRGVGSSAKASSRPAAPAGRMSVIPAEGTARTATPPRGMNAPMGRQGIAAGSRPSTPPMGVSMSAQTGQIPLSRTTTPQRSTTSQAPMQSRPVGTAGTSQAIQRPTPVLPGTQPGLGSTQPIARGTTPVPPGTQPGVGTRATTPPPGYGPRPSTPPPTSANSSSGISRPSTPPPTSANASGGIPRQGDTFNPPTVRGIVPQLTPGVQAPGFDEQAAFRDACALMEQKNWTGARQAFHALAAKVPASKQYRAWLCYTRGREAYLAGRIDDAIVELQRALQLEPDHAHAKHALAELQRRR